METVQIIDAENGINVVVPAIVTRESITVTAEAMAQAYGSSYLNLASQLANSLNVADKNGDKLEVVVDEEKGLIVKTDEVDINFNLEISDMVCTQHRDTTQIACDSQISVEMGFIEN